MGRKNKVKRPWARRRESMERKTGMTENKGESVKCRIKRKKKNRMFRKSLGEAAGLPQQKA